jgi:hypothetical protein
VQLNRAHLADEYASFYPDKRGVGVVIRFDEKYWFLEEPLRPATYDDYDYSGKEAPPGPFKRADFGDKDRLSWPCGACAISHSTQPMYWSERFAMWFVRDTVVVVDATRSVIMNLDFTGLAEHYYRSPLVHGGKLWFRQDPAAVWFELADFERLFDHAEGRLPVRVRELYPCHRPARELQVRIVELSSEARVRTHNGKVSFVVPRVLGMDLAMDITVHDEIYANHYLEVTLPGRPRQPLREPPPHETTSTWTLTFAPAVDPAGEIVRATEAPTRQAEIDRLFAALADEPDDDATRLVLIDSLEEAGEPYTPHLVALINGDESKRRDALGTLASYIDKIEYRNGLPHTGTLSKNAPLDDEIGNVVATDQRLGFFHTLRLDGDDHPNVYAKLVTSPRAVGLRHVDVPRAAILTALIAGNCRHLTRLSGVKFATREVIESLADPTFDSLRELQTETGAAAVAKLLEFVIRDELRFFARSPRHLILTERNRGGDSLVHHVLAAWDRLPLAKCTVAGITLARDDTAVASSDASEYSIGHVRTRFKI